MRKAIFLLAACSLVTACGDAPRQSGPIARSHTAEDPNEAVWHLRVGLNVAALMCKGRGRVSVAGDYARVLSRHRNLFASAHAAEQRRHGGGFESHQTRIYNRFANQRDPAGFCRQAAQVARRAAALDSPGLARSARDLVGQID